MAAQVERGHDVGYFFTGRHFARPSRPWTRRWQRGEIARWRQRWGAVGGRRRRLFDDDFVERAWDWSLRAVAREKPPLSPSRESGAFAAAFQRRRDVNVERMGRVGRVVAQSPRVAEIYEARGVSAERMTTLRFTLAHIEHLRPRSLGAPPSPITFATLGGCASHTKGSDLIAEPQRVLDMHGRVLAARDRIVRPLAEHVDAMDEIYREVAAG